MKNRMEIFKKNGVELEKKSTEGDITIYESSPTNSVAFAEGKDLISIFSNLNPSIKTHEDLVRFSTHYLLSVKSVAEILSESIDELSMPMFVKVIANQTENAARYGRVEGKFDDLSYSVVVTRGLTVLDIYKHSLDKDLE